MCEACLLLRQILYQPLADLSFAVRTFLTSVFIRVRFALFRKRRRALLLIRFAADLCCGMSEFLSQQC